jgi:hypothetical protein
MFRKKVIPKVKSIESSKEDQKKMEEFHPSALSIYKAIDTNKNAVVL